ncbi:hypothetical protein Tco_0663887 [Tanacetum coccineum]
MRNHAWRKRLDKPRVQTVQCWKNQDIPNQVSKAMDEIVMDAIDWAMQAPLKEALGDLPEADMKEILHNRMWESKSYQTHEDHMTLYEALEKSMARDNRDQLLSDFAEAMKKNKKRQGSPKTPSCSPPPPPPPPSPPPLPPAGPSRTARASGASGSSQLPPSPPPPSNTQGGQSTSNAAPSSSKTAASAEYMAWTMTDTRIKPSISPIPKELHMGDDTIADEQAYSSSGEDVGRDHIPNVNLRQSWWKPRAKQRVCEESRIAIVARARHSSLPKVLNISAWMGAVIDNDEKTDSGDGFTLNSRCNLESESSGQLMSHSHPNDTDSAAYQILWVLQIRNTYSTAIEIQKMEQDSGL